MSFDVQFNVQVVMLLHALSSLKHFQNFFIHAFVKSFWNFLLGKKTSTMDKEALVIHDKYGRHGDIFQLLFLYKRRVNGRI